MMFSCRWRAAPASCVPSGLRPLFLLLGLGFLQGAHAGPLFTEAPIPLQRPVQAHHSAKASPDASGFYEVDLLVLYARSYVDTHGGEAAAPGALQALVTDVNRIYSDSQVPIRFRLVQARAYDPEESLTEVYWNNPEVAAMRDEAGADLVMMAYGGEPGPENPCNGLAKGTFNSGALYDAAYTDDAAEPQYIDPETAYALVGLNGGECEAQVFAHELGHLCGAGHGRNQSGSGGWKAYAFAWQCGEPSYRSVMNEAEALGPRGPFFSNPALNRQGEACGNELSDNARALRLAAPYLPGYRAQKAAASAKNHRLGSGSLAPFPLVLLAFAVIAGLWRSRARRGKR